MQCNIAGEWNITGSCRALPPAPSSVTIGQITTTSIVFTFTGTAGCSTYLISYYCLNTKINQQYNVISSNQVISTTITGLVPGYTYQLTASVCNSEGCSSSPSVNVTTLSGGATEIPNLNPNQQPTTSSSSFSGEWFGGGIAVGVVAAALILIGILFCIPQTRLLLCIFCRKAEKSEKGAECEKAAATGKPVSSGLPLTPIGPPQPQPQISATTAASPNVAAFLCASCQALVSENEQFCPVCKTAQWKICPGCQMPVDLLAKYCPSCGSPCPEAPRRTVISTQV